MPVKDGRTQLARATRSGGQTIKGLAPGPHNVEDAGENGAKHVAVGSLDSEFLMLVLPPSSSTSVVMEAFLLRGREEVCRATSTRIIPSLTRNRKLENKPHNIPVVGPLPCWVRHLEVLPQDPSHQSSFLWLRHFQVLPGQTHVKFQISNNLWDASDITEGKEKHVHNVGKGECEFLKALRCERPSQGILSTKSILSTNGVSVR